MNYRAGTNDFAVTHGLDTRERTTNFDRVVMTVPSPAISQACPQLTSDEHARLNEAEYLGVVCTSLLLDRPLGGFYVTNITDTWVPLTGIIEMGSIVPPEKMDYSNRMPNVVSCIPGLYLLNSAPIKIGCLNVNQFSTWLQKTWGRHPSSTSPERCPTSRRMRDGCSIP